MMTNILLKFKFKENFEYKRLLKNKPSLSFIIELSKLFEIRRPLSLLVDRFKFYRLVILTLFRIKMMGVGENVFYEISVESPV